MPRKVLVGGVFNIAHRGHELFLRKAKERGDFLIVVIASNRTANVTKGYMIADQKERKRNVEALGIADKVVLGHDTDFMETVRRERPDVIVLGHDQKISEKELKRLLLKEGMRCEVVRIRETLKGYSASKIMRKIKKKEEDY